MKEVNSSQFIVHRFLNTVNREPTTANRPGQGMIIALVFLAVVLIIASSLFTRVADFIRFGSNSVMNEQATELADAGIDYATQRLNDLAGAYPDASGAGTDTQALSTGQVVIQIVNKSQNLKTITATGYIPNTTNPRAKRTVKADVGIDTTIISFNYAVQVGDGGLTMGGGSSIKGNVWSIGNIIGSPGTSIDGDAYSAGSIGPSPYPSVTASHDKYPNQPSPPPMPTLNYNQMKIDAEVGGIIDCLSTPSECTITTSKNIGPKKYINGDLTITNNAIVTMAGPIHVESHNFTLSGGQTVLQLSDSSGSNGKTMLVDGLVTVNQGEIKPNNATPKGYILIATTSTSSSALTLGNRGELAIFYALEGGAVLGNNTEANAIIAKSLTLGNNAEVEYKTGLASAQFSSGPGGSWQIKKGTYKFTNSP